ncbi:pepsin/retropepsin-like aspartic protease family protein [Fluviicola sp.]|uniref:pepsin/retropepsin-like aspartic protease family protein n=1 Tax=Fluviicola sp. TaxID=1917219 RepID=UPI0031D6AD9E
MKILLLSLFILPLTLSAQKHTHPFDAELFYQELGVLSSKKDFFEIKELLIQHKSKIDPEVYFYYWGLVENAFSHFKESNEAIESFFSGADFMNNDTLFKEILLVKQLNLVNLFEYKEAYLTNRYILDNFAHVCSEEELADLSNTGLIWKDLQNQGKQHVHLDSDVKIQLVRDKMRLATVPVKVSGVAQNFVFDTGANFSVIQRSVAEQMNCEIIPIQFDVTAITGVKVKSDLAVVKELYMGDIRCENVVFLVFNDKDLTFADADYAIRGIIGFPVIRSLNEIRLNKADELFVPKVVQQFPQSNMAINGFVPSVQVVYQSDTLQFSFDTGAAETFLNSTYYQKYKHLVEKKGKKKTLKSGGAGGTVEYTGYILPKVTLSVGSSSATLRNVQVRKEVVTETDAGFAGNLGQDFIKQFSEMIISFKYSAIQFR